MYVSVYRVDLNLRFETNLQHLDKKISIQSEKFSFIFELIPMIFFTLDPNICFVRYKLYLLSYNLENISNVILDKKC